MTETLRAVVLAFDGLVADTLGARAQAIADALTSEGTPTTAEVIAQHVAGHSLEETIEHVLQQRASHRGLSFDYTTRDLAVLRARRSFSAIISLGLPLQPNAISWIADRAASGVKVILRADSARADVERLLQLSELGNTFAFSRCSDDLPRIRGLTTTQTGWNVILQRLGVMQLTSGNCRAIEVSQSAAKIAQTLISDVVLASILL